MLARNRCSKKEQLFYYSLGAVRRRGDRRRVLDFGVSQFLSTRVLGDGKHMTLSEAGFKEQLTYCSASKGFEDKSGLVVCSTSSAVSGTAFTMAL